MGRVSGSTEHMQTSKAAEESVMFTFTHCHKQTHGTAHLSRQIGAGELSLTRRGLKLAAQYLALLVLSLLLVPAARAQVLYGSLVGKVTDPNGAAVGGAKVEIRNLATGDVSTANTDDRGAYALHDLQGGVYRVLISRASFKTTVKEDVRIEANKNNRF